MRIWQVDAFTTSVFAGNPAAVLVVEEWTSDATMLSIAAENNLAETAFARPRGDGTWDLRWMTPVMEVDFCGHATLATAHVLFAEDPAATDLTFHTRVGLLTVTRATGGYRLSVPCLPPGPLDRLPDQISHLTPRAAFRNFENLFVDLGSADAVVAFTPDLAALATLGRTGLAVTGQGGAADFTSRYFAPGAGIPEDPVTGSIHATLVPYWAGRLGRDRLSAHQASARGGWIDCELVGDRVILEGSAVTYLEGRIFLS